MSFSQKISKSTSPTSVQPAYPVSVTTVYSPPSLKVKLLESNAKSPFKAHSSDAGFDLFCIEDVQVKCGVVNKLRTGIAVAVPKGFYGRIAPRSGLAFKHGADVLAGVVDSGYRGEVQVLMSTLRDFEFKAGDKVAQLVLERISDIDNVEVVEDLDSTERGSGGFGSTDQRPTMLSQ